MAAEPLLEALQPLGGLVCQQGPGSVACVIALCVTAGTSRVRRASKRERDLSRRTQNDLMSNYLYKCALCYPQDGCVSRVGLDLLTPPTQFLYWWGTDLRRFINQIKLKCFTFAPGGTSHLHAIKWERMAAAELWNSAGKTTLQCKDYTLELGRQPGLCCQPFPHIPVAVIASPMWPPV